MTPPAALAEQGVEFNTPAQLQRGGLLLLDGVAYAGYGGNSGDCQECACSFLLHGLPCGHPRGGATHPCPLSASAVDVSSAPEPVRRTPRRPGPRCWRASRRPLDRVLLQHVRQQGRCAAPTPSLWPVVQDSCCRSRVTGTPRFRATVAPSDAQLRGPNSSSHYPCACTRSHLGAWRSRKRRRLHLRRHRQH